MKVLLPVFLLTLAAFGQAPASLPPETVVVKVGSKPLTAAQVRKLVSGLPDEIQQAVMQNPKSAIQSLFLLDFLKTEAARQNLETVSPFKEQLDMQRMQVLAQAAVAKHSEGIVVTPEEARKRYEKDKEQFEIAKIRGIFIGFADPKKAAEKPTPDAPPKKSLTEAEAKAKADDLVKQARAGADFAELARNNSDDVTTAGKGGEYGAMRRGDKIPEDIKTAIFSQKAGGVSEPLHQPQGFFIVKVEERKLPAFEDVQGQLMTDMKQEVFSQWMQGLQKQFEVTVEKQEFFPAPPPATGPQVSVRQIQ